MRTFVSAFLFLLCTVAAAPPAGAQTAHVAPPSALDEALQHHVDPADRDREVIQRLLDRPEVGALAADVGLDLRDARAAVATLDGPRLAELAVHARNAEQARAGGQSVTISYTLIIIGLLVLILLILVLD